MTTRTAALLGVVHARPGITRAQAARTIGVGTGAATELVARLGRAALITEAPATPSGARGRPTTVLLPHPSGPLIAAVGITHESWRVDVVELGGATLHTRRGRHDGHDVLATVAAELRRSPYDRRLRGVGVAAPGTVSRTHHLDNASLGWHALDLRAVRPDAEILVTGNDATLAAAAESARGAAAGAAVALHLRVEAGLGAAVVDHGRVLTGAAGFGGEFGHMPFGDPAIRCPCGAYGCWGTAVDGSALARLLGDAPPGDPVSYARRVIADPAAAPAVRTVAAALGRGMAGLVNGLDADVVTLGGLGTDLLDAAGDEMHAAYRAGLMSVRRADPPPVLPSALGEDGPIAGAAEQAWTALLSRLPTG